MILRKPLHVFSAVIRALFLRELELRMSAGKTGLFWTFSEPFFQIFIFIIIRLIIVNGTGQSAITHYDYAVFMASGFVAFNIFKSILSTSSGAFMANKALFSYKQVKPIDTIVGRVMIELFLSSIIMFIFLLIGFFFQYDNFLPDNTLLVFAGYLWFVIFSFAISLVVAIGNSFFLSIGKFISIISFGLLIFSAVFFPLISLPPVAQEILLYNPLVHFMEMIHGAYLDGLDDRFVDYHYMLLWTVIPLFVGFWLYIKLEKRLISS